MEEIDLKEFLKYLRKYIWIMLAAVVLFLSVALVYDLKIKTPLYKSTTTVVLNKSEGSSSRATVQEDLTTLNYNQKLVATYSELVKSNSVLGQVAEELNIEGGANTLKKQIKVGNIEDTEILTISVEDKDAEQAAIIANKTADVFADVIEDKYGQKNVSQFDKAEVSSVQSNNTTLRDAGIAAFVGFFLVVAVAFLIYYFDDSVKYSKNLENELDMPVIGKIAHGELSSKKNKNIKNESEIMLISMPKASVSESIRNLRANLSFSSVDKGLKSLLITSTNASEGKSFCSSNLATAYAQSGKSVLLIDGDLRKGRLHRMFKLRNARGFSDLLIDAKSKSYDKYLKETKIEGLTVITRGTCPPNPSELLGSARAKTVIKKLLEQFDMVIIDGAPSMGLSDSIVASKLVDGVVLVCRDGKTNRADLVSVVNDYKKIDAPFLGVVMNDIKRRSAGYGYYNYYEKDRSVADQKTMEGLNELDDAIEASREALSGQFHDGNSSRKKRSNKSSFVKDDYSDLPTRAELKRMAKNKTSSRYRHAQEKNS